MQNCEAASLAVSSFAGTSYYLQSNKDDFSELDAETRQFDTSDVLFVTRSGASLTPASPTARKRMSAKKMSISDCSLVIDH